MQTALLKILKATIDAAYQAGNTTMAGQGFGKQTPIEVLQHLQQRYSQPSRLQEPMDYMQLIEVMLQQIKEVQIFLLVTPKEGQEHSNVTLIQHALIKLSKTGECTQSLWNIGR